MRQNTYLSDKGLKLNTHITFFKHQIPMLLRNTIYYVIYASIQLTSSVLHIQAHHIISTADLRKVLIPIAPDLPQTVHVKFL